MRISTLIIAILALLLRDVASEEDGIKRGTFPFMAFVYYPDQTVDDGLGGKFTRSAVLIQENWLITSSLETDIIPSAFPEKTLVARLGAITIDVKFNFNEDESEQEREIIRVVRPYDFNRTEWWYSDISLLKTLLPFNVTATVKPFAIKSNKMIGENCFMLVYAKHIQKITEERILIKMLVNLTPSSQDKCGSNFSNDTMACAFVDDKSIISTSSDFCEGNSGGPLICDNDLIGTQTYVNGCKEPFLYQLLGAWEDLISCSIEEKCEEEQCAKICTPINKDPTTITTTTSTISITEEKKIKLADGYLNETSISTITVPTLTIVAETSETTTLPSTTSTTVRDIQGTTITTTTTSEATISTGEDTTVGTSENTVQKKTEMADLQEEPVRTANVEAKQQVLSGDAATNTFRSFKYFMYGYFIVLGIV